MAASEAVAHCLVVQSESVHRIQEAQDALVLRLWSVVQAAWRRNRRRLDDQTSLTGQLATRPGGSRSSSASRRSAVAGPGCTTRS